MLLYVEYSQPDSTNPVQELSKVLVGTRTGTYRNMLDAIKCVLDTKIMGLCISLQVTGLGHT